MMVGLLKLKLLVVVGVGGIWVLGLFWLNLFMCGFF